jgi:hypothetical protein
VRRLPLRCPRGGGHAGRPVEADRAGPRGRRGGRGRWAGRNGLARGRSGRSRLPQRSLRGVRAVPPRRLRELCEPGADRHHRRWRLRGGCLRTRVWTGSAARRDGLCRPGAAAVRGPDGVQRVAAGHRRRPTRVAGGRPGNRRTGSPRHPIRRQARLPRGGRRPGQPCKSSAGRPPSSRPPPTGHRCRR